MRIFTWIVLGIAALLMAASGICWAIHLAADNLDVRRLGVKIFRIAMVFVLFYGNVAIYAHIFGFWGGEQKAAVEAVEEQ